MHDRQKRVVNTPDDVIKLGRALVPPVIFDARVHKVHKCACCENLFVDTADIPRYCAVCDPKNPLTHQLGGPLGNPIGVVF